MPSSDLFSFVSNSLEKINNKKKEYEKDIFATEYGNRQGTDRADDGSVTPCL
jgi:hypothetical protein